MSRSRCMGRTVVGAALAACLLCSHVGAIAEGVVATGGRARLAADSITVQGVVIDASVKSGRPVAQQAVTLMGDRGGRPVPLVEGRTDRHGVVTLRVAAQRGVAYRLRTVYRGVEYSAGVALHGVAVRLQLPVYDTVADDGGIGATAVLIGVRRSGRRLVVIEDWTLTNLSSPPRTIVGPDGTSGRGALTLPLPEGATRVQVRSLTPSPDRATVRRGAIVVDAVARPFNPADPGVLHHLIFSFIVPPTARTTHPTLLIPTRYYLRAVQVFSLSGRLQAPGFTAATLPLGRRTLPAVLRQNVLPGSLLAVGIDGAPVAAPVTAVTLPPGPPPPFPTAPVAAIIELGFGALLVMALRGGWLTARGEVLTLQRERARLIGALAALDLQHTQGVVSDDEYHRRRQEEKRRLLVVVRRLGE